MLNRLSTDTVNLLLIIGGILLVIELFFFDGGLIFSLLFSGIMCYFGWKHFRKLWAKFLFWIGLVSLILTVLHMFVIRFLLVALLIIVLINYFRSKSKPDTIAPELTAQAEPIEKENIIVSKSIFQSLLFGKQATSNSAYHWTDINIQGCYGDKIIDLSNTVLPEEAIISIRHIVGNITIYIPYDVEMSILHSAVIGRVKILGYKEESLITQSCVYETENFQTNYPRVRIITSIVSGDIEVKRI